MPPIARRGRTVYLLLAVPIVVDCVIAIVFALAGWQPFHWNATLLFPTTIALMVAVLWQ